MSTTTTDSSTGISTGAGIAIAAVWFSNMLLTLALLWMFFGSLITGTPQYDASSDGAIGGFVIAMAICALPSVASYHTTKLILPNK